MNNDPYSTHRPVLEKLLTIIDKTKPILELGCGNGSTPILHKFSKDNKILLHTLDNNKEWLEKVSLDFKSNRYHKYKEIKDWKEDLREFLDTEWSLVFIDQSPWEARAISLEYFKNKCDYVVLHDCDYFPNNNVFGKQISPIKSKEDFGERDYSDVLKNYLEYFPINFACPTGPPTLLGSQFHKIDFEIDKKR